MVSQHHLTARNRGPQLSYSTVSGFLQNDCEAISLGLVRASHLAIRSTVQVVEIVE
jgi:hypothetical protein